MSTQVDGLTGEKPIDLLGLPNEIKLHITSFLDLQAKGIIENGKEISQRDALRLTCKDLRSTVVVYNDKYQNEAIKIFIDFLISNLDRKHSKRIEKLQKIKESLSGTGFVIDSNILRSMMSSTATKELLISVLSEKLYIRTEISPNSSPTEPLPELTGPEIDDLQAKYNLLETQNKPANFSNFFESIKKNQEKSDYFGNPKLEDALNFFLNESNDVKRALRIVNLLDLGYQRSEKLRQICEITKRIISSSTEEDLKYAAELVQSLPTKGTVQGDGIGLFKRFLSLEISKTWAAKLGDTDSLPFTETEIIEKLEKIKHLKNAKERKEGYMELITSLTSQQNWDEAIKITSTMREGKGFREMAKIHIAQGLIIAGNFDKAFEVTKTITNSLLKRRLLDDIVPGLIAEKKWDQALEGVKMAPKNPFSSVVSGYGIDSKTGQKYLIRELAPALVDANEWDHAFQLFLVNKEEVALLGNFMTGCMEHFIEHKNWRNALEVLSHFTEETYRQRFHCIFFPIENSFEAVVRGMESEHVEDAALWAKAKEINGKVVRNTTEENRFEHLGGPLEAQSNKRRKLGESVRGYHSIG